MMNREEIVEMTNDVFEESFEIERSRLVPESHIFDQLGLDSLDTVDLIVALQRKFGVQIRQDERIHKIRTLNDIYDFIAEMKREGAADDGG
jgi:acyl carrier protein